MYIVCEGNFKVEDIVKSSKKATLKQTRQFSIIGILFFLLGIIFLGLKISKAFDASFLIWILIVCGILIVIIPYVLTAIIPVFLFKQNKTLALGFDYKYEFFDESFSVSIISPNSKTNNILNYDVIYKVDITEDIIYLFLNSNVTYMIKKDSFQSDDDCMKALTKFKIKKEKNKK